MEKEIKIVNFNERKEKTRVIEDSANRVISSKPTIINVNNDLSSQLFKNSSSIYLNPTEQMIFGNLKLNDATVATILGSGDFVFDLAYQGAKNIVSFDINLNQLRVANLKLKAMQHMEYDNYYSFFSDINSSNYLSEKTYKELKRISEKDPALYSFFDIIFRKKEEEVKRIRRHPMYQYVVEASKAMGHDYTLVDIEANMTLQSIDPSYRKSALFDSILGLAGSKSKGTYLESNENYDKARKNLKNTDIRFINTDVSNFKGKLDATGYTTNPNFEGFDLIYLSNVPEYISGEKFSCIVDHELMPLLKENGAIMYCCQATNLSSITVSREQLEEMKKNIQLTRIPNTNPISQYQMVNSIESYLLLSEKYDITTHEQSTYALINGLEGNDTYIYVKRK